MNDTANDADGQSRVAHVVGHYAARLDELPAALAATLERFATVRSIEHLPERVVLTGIGASEGPARALAAVLALCCGLNARYASPSSFCAPSLPHARESALIVFSQGLSPNARLALRHAASFRRAILFSSMQRGERTDKAGVALDGFLASGGELFELPPRRESGALVRVVGPACASLAGLCFAARLPGAPNPQAHEHGFGLAVAALASVPRLVREARRRASVLLDAHPSDVLTRSVAFVTTGPALELHHGLRNKWLETLPGPEPPIWDVLGFAHGPFQEVYERSATIIALERAEDARGRALVDRLARMLVPERHALVRVGASTSGLTSLFEHDAIVNELVLRALSLRPRDTTSWPGSRLDGPLYQLDDEP